MVAPVKTPWPQSRLSNTSGASRARRPPKTIAESGTPCGSSKRGEIDGHWRAATVKRELGCAAFPVPSQRLPCQSMRSAGGLLSLPSHHGMPSFVTATLVKMVSARDRRERVRVRVGAGARRDAEEAGLRVDGPQASVGPGPKPRDVVADRPHLVALRLEGRHQHREVGLAAGRREGGGHVVALAVRQLELQDQHVLGHPALLARERRGDPQREALLAEERVAAVAGADAPDRALLREVHDEAAIRATGRRASAARVRSPRRRRAGRARLAPMRVMIRMFATT